MIRNTNIGNWKEEAALEQPHQNGWTILLKMGITLYDLQ